jgi:hypothetical protein
MALFVEVKSVEKKCTVIVNLEHIVEIAPLAQGGCALFMSDGAGMNSKNAMVVEDDYTQFKQFAMQTVSSEDISKRFPKVTKEKPPIDDIVKPSKVSKGKGDISDLSIPKL